MRRPYLLVAALLVACGARSELDDKYPERCNGIDDDDDGAVDEGIPDLTCGLGACAATAPGCVNGKPGRCTPRSPQKETCNELDDDCDGLTDEDLPFGLVSGPHKVGDEFAMGRAIEATDNGALAVWSIGFNGRMPTPNTFAQPLDDDGRPIGTRQQLLVDPVVVGPGLAPASNGRLTVSMCRRFGFDDRPSWLFVDTTGAPAAAEHPVQVPGEACTTFDTSPQMIWTDRKHLFVWTTGTSSQVIVESTDAAGNTGVTELLVSNGDLSAPPRFARHDDRLTVVVGLQPASELAVLFLDLDGTLVGGPITLPDPGGSRYLQPRVAVDPDGVMLIVAKHRFGPGWIRARVSFDGTVVEAPVLVPEELTLRSLEARPAGGFWAGGERGTEGDAHLFHLDATGTIVESWPLPEPGWRPELTQRNGRIYLLYDAPLTPKVELHSVVFGCVD